MATYQLRGYAGSYKKIDNARRTAYRILAQHPSRKLIDIVDGKGNDVGYVSYEHYKKGKNGYLAVWVTDRGTWNLKTTGQIYNKIW